MKHGSHRSLDMATHLDYTLHAISLFGSTSYPTCILLIGFHCLFYMLSHLLASLLILHAILLIISIAYPKHASYDYFTSFPSLGTLQVLVLEDHFHLLHIPLLSISAYPPACCSIISYTLLDIGTK